MDWRTSDNAYINSSPWENKYNTLVVRIFVQYIYHLSSKITEKIVNLTFNLKINKGHKLVMINHLKV
jgi:hypothetical protein